MSSSTHFCAHFFAASALLLACSVQPWTALADDYGFRFDFGSDFNGPNWVDNDNPFNSDGTLRHAGPPGSGTPRPSPARRAMSSLAAVVPFPA